jgi:Flp pilus assembly pilin Flp
MGWRRFWSDSRGAALRAYALAVVAGTACAVVIMTLLAQDLYNAYLRFYRP